MAKTGQETIVVTGPITEFGFLQEKTKQINAATQKLSREGKEIVNIVESLPTSVLGIKTQEIRIIWRIPDKPVTPSLQKAPVQAQEPFAQLSPAQKWGAVSVTSENFDAIVERIFMFLEDGEWERADYYCEQALNFNPKSGTLYLGKLMAELQVKKEFELEYVSEPFDSNDNYLKACRYDPSIAQRLNSYNNSAQHKANDRRKENTYNRAVSLMKSAKTEDDFKAASFSFSTILTYKDAKELYQKCNKEAEAARLNAIYKLAVSKISSSSLSSNEEAIKLFESIIDWKDSRAKIDECKAKTKEIKIAEGKSEAERIHRAEEEKIVAEKRKARIKKTATIGGPVVATLVVFLILLNMVIIPQIKLKKAMAQLNAGNYEKAYSMLDELGKSEIIKSSKYDRAISLAEKGEYDAAILILKQLSGYKNTDDKLREITMQYYKSKWDDVSVGDNIFFGFYEQDNNSDNGKEEIEWRVLSKEENRIFVVSEYALDCQPYNTKRTSVTWETCSLRKWLNDSFLNSAFSSMDQEMILSSKVKADKNPSYSTNPGKDTIDKIFLLSITESKKYFTSDDDRTCVPTTYAIRHGGYTNSSYTKGDNATCWWWLRSPGYYFNRATNVYYYGEILDYGYHVDANDVCVRPAMWIEI